MESFTTGTAPAGTVLLGMGLTAATREPWFFDIAFVFATRAEARRFRADNWLADDRAPSVDRAWGKWLLGVRDYARGHQPDAQLTRLVSAAIASGLTPAARTWPVELRDPAGAYAELEDVRAAYAEVLANA